MSIFSGTLNPAFYEALRIGFLGLAVTFFALFILRIIISLLAKIQVRRQAEMETATEPSVSHAEETLMPESNSDIAVITSVLTAMGVANTGGRIRIEKISG